MWSDEVIRIGLDAWGIIFYPAPMRIGFPAFVMQGGKSGVAVYIKSLFSHLQKVDLENQYELMVPRDEQDIMRIVGYPEEKISVIYSGIDSNLFRPVSRDQARTELRKRDIGNKVLSLARSP